MHRLNREIRFTIPPFPTAVESGNSYCSKPDCEGLGVFLSLWVEIGGEVDKQTGFVVNLADIDKLCRKYAVPMIKTQVQQSFAKQKNISLSDIKNIIADCFDALKGCFAPSKVLSITIKLNPYRKIKILPDNKKMIYYSEKFEFAATHKLWNEKLSDEDNFKVFGKCANPTGHGHNYIVEITVKVSDTNNFTYKDFQKTVADKLIDILDHKNLNEDVPFFFNTNPTVENITTYAWQQLESEFESARLGEITIWENDRAFCTYKGEK